ncbi:type II toxin-antitoxin system RelE/ParE family toxin [Brevundimonas sp. VNH65]|uniref:type II toxin-antitoxin system RelE/ParE family toxin n=1 Tax=Brevundimonas sp. VNH65 TaxID=3400917 RepID=UPI003C11C7A6
MTQVVHLSRRAVEDISIATDTYLAEAGVHVASTFLDHLERTLARISEHPASGSPRYALDMDLPNLRCVRVTNFPYLVFYIEALDGLEVWRVLHGARDIPQSLRPEGPEAD